MKGKKIAIRNKLAIYYSESNGYSVYAPDGSCLSGGYYSFENAERYCLNNATFAQNKKTIKRETNIANREIVMRIPEDKYDRLIQQMRLDRNFRECEITELGEHGRLGDLDALEEEIINGINAGLMIDGYEDYSHINDTEDCLECVKYADTIIKANHPAPVKEKHKSRDDGWTR